MNKKEKEQKYEIIVEVKESENESMSEGNCMVCSISIKSERSFSVNHTTFLFN